MSELVARPFAPADRAAWDAYVRASRMPHPMLCRDWVEYHADRFVDASLVVVDASKPSAVVAVLPASAHGDEVRSHGGLSFGGLVTSHKVGAARALDALRACARTYAATGFARLAYKAVPHIFHAEPAQEDLYALTRLGAALVRRDVSSVIDLSMPSTYSERRRRSLRRADMDVCIRAEDDYEGYVSILERVLERHGASPVHTPDELARLAASFPDELELLIARDASGVLLGGTLLVRTPVTVHAQYIAGLPEGQRLGVVDRLLDAAIEQARADERRWFNLGISTERDGTYLNEGLQEYKESFGARAVVYDHYELEFG